MGHEYILNARICNKIQEFVSGIATPITACFHGAVKQWSATEAVAADADGVHGEITLGASAQTITADITNPPCARNITITCTKASGGSTMSGDVVITGTNIFGEVITDTIAEGEDGLHEGTKAFKTVTSILVPAQTNAGDKLKIGFGDKLGLPFYLNYADQVIQCSLNNVIEATRATVVADVDEIEKNTIDLNSALNGSVVRAYIMVYEEYE